MVLLASCATIYDLKTAESDIQKGTFQHEMVRLYRQFSEEEARQYDWVDAQHFINKALRMVYGNKEVLPEDPNNWKLPEPMMPQLQAARNQLINMFEQYDVRKLHPTVAAKTQFYYDCWVEQQEENWQSGDIDVCKTGFYNGIKQIEKLKNEDELLQKEIAKIPESHIFFAHNQHKPGKQDMKTIEKIATHLKKLPADAVIEINGYADRAGQEAYNLQLSTKRASEVKKLLIQYGVPEAQLYILAFGEFGQFSADPRW